MLDTSHRPWPNAAGSLSEKTPMRSGSLGRVVGACCSCQPLCLKPLWCWCGLRCVARVALAECIPSMHPLLSGIQANSSCRYFASTLLHMLFCGWLSHNRIGFGSFSSWVQSGYSCILLLWNMVELSTPRRLWLQSILELGFTTFDGATRRVRQPFRVVDSCIPPFSLPSLNTKNMYHSYAICVLRNLFLD